MPISPISSQAAYLSTIEPAASNNTLTPNQVEQHELKATTDSSTPSATLLASEAASVIPEVPLVTQGSMAKFPNFGPDSKI